MRILTVRQPWASLIIFGGKDVENRTRNLAGDYRGPIAIHSGAKADLPALERMTGRIPFRLDQYSAIVGVVDLTDVHGGRDVVEGGQCSDWAEDWRFHLVLANPRRLPTPIPYKGALGLTTLPDHVTQQIKLALAGGTR